MDAVTTWVPPSALDPAQATAALTAFGTRCSSVHASITVGVDAQYVPQVPFKTVWGLLQSILLL